jgi:PadR family transcriptional regulator, regulatory protein AphA
MTGGDVTDITHPDISTRYTSLMELSPTAKVILGMLRMAPRSGYAIKAFVDDSTAFFYSAGYGSIYPELRKLREAGLVRGIEDPAGDRRRVVYALTADGKAALEDWLGTETGPCELRDEGLLQLFFSADSEQAAEALERKAAEHATVLERLGAIEEKARAADSPFPELTRSYGVGLHEYARRWCEEQAARLRAGDTDLATNPGPDPEEQD